MLKASDDLEFNITDCSKLKDEIQISYRRLIGPDGFKFPYYYACMKTESIHWTIISTKLSNRYKPILVDDILAKCPYEIDLAESSLTVGLAHIAALVVVKSPKFIDNQVLVPAFMIINSYNGSTATSIYIGCKNKDTNYFMPYLSHKFAMKHNLKATVSDLYKQDMNHCLKKCIDFVDVCKQARMTEYKKDLVHISSDLQGTTLYEAYVEQVQKFQSKKLTQMVLFDKVRTIEDLYLHLTSKK